LIAHQYYYFIASLPGINYGDVPPMSTEDFREQCSRLLEADDEALLQYCSFDPKLALRTIEPTGSDFIDSFLHREKVLILTLAFTRAGRLKRPLPENPPHDVPRAEALGKRAFDMEFEKDDPLAAMIYIDEGRWGALDSTIGIDYFGVDNIFAYFLKLQLLERRQVFDAVKGRAEYQRLYDTILNEYNSKLKEDK
jgi:hypothetical protein